MRLILYSKPDCHLCEGLREKLEQIQSIEFELEVRDITTNPEWFEAYQYEIPVLFLVRSQKSGVRSRESGAGEQEREGVGEIERQGEQRLPRLSPRATVQQVEQMLQRYELTDSI